MLHKFGSLYYAINPNSKRAKRLLEALEADTVTGANILHTVLVMFTGLVIAIGSGLATTTFEDYSTAWELLTCISTLTFISTVFYGVAMGLGATRDRQLKQLRRLMRRDAVICIDKDFYNWLQSLLQEANIVRFGNEQYEIDGADFLTLGSVNADFSRGLAEDSEFRDTHLKSAMTQMLMKMKEQRANVQNERVEQHWK